MSAKGGRTWPRLGEPGMTPSDLAARWRVEAAVLRRRGADHQGAVLESCASDLEQWAREHELEALTLEQAELESGYTYSALQKMVAAGRLLNVGEPHRPRVRRGDLPKKARSRPITPIADKHDGPDLAKRVLTGPTRPPLATRRKASHTS